MSWIAYHMTPIDFGWEQLQSVSEIAGKLLIEALPDFMKNFERAKEVALKAGWDESFLIGPCVFWLPDEVEFSYGFVWKHSDNGSTFVASPHPLPWLESLSLK